MPPFPPQEIVGLTKGSQPPWSLSNPITRPTISCKGGIWGGGTLRFPSFSLMTQNQRNFSTSEPDKKPKVWCSAEVLCDLQASNKLSVDPKIQGQWPARIVSLNRIFSREKIKRLDFTPQKFPRNKRRWCFFVSPSRVWFWVLVLSFGFCQKARLVERFKGTRPVPKGKNVPNGVYQLSHEKNLPTVLSIKS